MKLDLLTPTHGPRPVPEGELPFGKQFFQKLFDNLYDGVYFVDRERRLLFWNRGAERISGYRSDEVVGSYCYDNILDHTDAGGCHLCHSGCPLVCSIKTGQPTAQRVFLKHKDGRRIAVEVHTMPLENDRGEVIGGVEVFRDATEMVALEAAYGKLRELADKDPLTGIANRRHLDRMLDYHFEMLHRTGIQLSVILCDIDHFKSVNDTFGHLVGDQAIIQVASTLQAQIRDADILGRFGGEEFLLLLPGVELPRAIGLAERLRRAVQQNPPPTLAERGLTISLGVVQARAPESIESMLARVDTALYRAKANGRNRAESQAD